MDIVGMIVAALVSLLAGLGLLLAREGILVRRARRASKTVPTIEDRHRTIGVLVAVAVIVAMFLVAFINVLNSRSASVAQSGTSIVGRAGAAAAVAMATPSVPVIAADYSSSAPYPTATAYSSFAPYPSSTPHPTSTPCPPSAPWPTSTAYPRAMNYSTFTPTPIHQ